MKLPKERLQELAAIHLASLAEGKAHYKQADAALDELTDHAAPGVVIEMPAVRPAAISAPQWAEIRGKKFAVADKFAKKKSIGVGQSARRYELEEIKQLGAGG